MKALTKLKKPEVTRILAGALGLLLALTLVVASVAPVLAIQQLPHRFWGTVYIDSAPAPQGTEVVARIAGVAENFTAVVDVDHHYGYAPAFNVKGDDPETPEKEGGNNGDTIEFYVAGTWATNFTFSSGTYNVLNLGVVPTQYNLTINSTAGGNVTTPGEDTFTYNASEVVDLVATHDTGYAFVNWTGEVSTIGDENSATTNITMNDNYTIVANFAVTETYNLTISSTSGGTVTTPGEGVKGPYANGTVVDLVATHDTGYAFVNWTGEVSTIGDENSATTNITMNDNYTILANFEAIPQYNLTINSTDGGNVTTPGEGVKGPYANGTVVDLVATHDTGYAFVNWTGEVSTIGDENSATTNITMNDNYTIMANFAVTPTSFNTTLSAGWNLLSTPILLDADSDSLGEIFDAQSLSNIDVSYSWNGTIWVPLDTTYELSPLYAIYVKVISGGSATATFVPSEERSELPNRELQRGLNLIGPAPAYNSTAIDFPAMPLDQALITIEEAEGGLRGYTMVVSPGLNQPGWAYAIGGTIQDLRPYKGYWVVMENGPDTLYGFSTTPIQ